jgi:ABC-2 type transport system permease protein
MGETKREKLALLSRFYSYYPEYKNADTVRSGFLDFKAYSAFVTLADREAKPKVDEYYLSILQRNQAIAAFDFINPAVNTQNIFNRISETGLENSFDFRYSVALFHTQVCRFCFTPLFSGRLMKNEDYKHIPTFVKRQDETIRHSVFREVCWLLLLPFLTGIIAGFKLGTI